MKKKKGNYCRPMINNPPPFKGLNIMVPIIILIEGRGFIKQGSGLLFTVWSWLLAVNFTYARWTLHLVIVTIRVNSDYIRVLSDFFSTNITGSGVLLIHMLPTKTRYPKLLTLPRLKKSCPKLSWVSGLDVRLKGFLSPYMNHCNLLSQRNV